MLPNLITFIHIHQESTAAGNASRAAFSSLCIKPVRYYDDDAILSRTPSELERTDANVRDTTLLLHKAAMLRARSMQLEDYRQHCNEDAEAFSSSTSSTGGRAPSSFAPSHELEEPAISAYNLPVSAPLSLRKLLSDDDDYSRRNDLKEGDDGSTLRYTAVEIDDVNDFQDHYSLRCNQPEDESRKIRCLVVVTMYNENPVELEGTLTCLARNIGYISSGEQRAKMAGYVSGKGQSDVQVLDGLVLRTKTSLNPFLLMTLLPLSPTFSFRLVHPMETDSGLHC
jgi:hypothetical protein